MTAPKAIKGLIERFQENRDVYCSSQYNEAQARIEFIDPFFKALGWDMTNEKGYAEAYKDLQTAKIDHDKKFIQRRIDATDKQIDQLVYELYELTEKEIRIVEEATK
jgi:predicted type IV restriction endonuclease